MEPVAPERLLGSPRTASSPRNTSLDRGSVAGLVNHPSSIWSGLVHTIWQCVIRLQTQIGVKIHTTLGIRSVTKLEGVAKGFTLPKFIRQVDHY